MEIPIPSECTRCFYDQDGYCPRLDKKVEICPLEFRKQYPYGNFYFVERCPKCGKETARLIDTSSIDGVSGVGIFKCFSCGYEYASSI